MSTPSIATSQRLLASEKRAERQALSVLHGTTFTDCLKVNSILPALDVLTPEGKTITLRGSDIYDRKTWKKFLDHANHGEEVYQITEIAEHLAIEYKAWLLNDYTPRYRALSTEADIAWLERVITLAITRHIMEEKYRVYTVQGLEAFADPQAAIEMGKLLMFNSMVKEAARLIHHIVKKPDQAQHLLEQFSDELYHRLQDTLLPARESLPSLLPGNTPYSALGRVEGEIHE